MRTAVICIALLLVCTQAVSVHKTLTNSQVKRIDNLKKGSSWGAFMMELAEMHTLAQGPLDELVTAIEEVIQDVETKLEKTHAEFDTRTSEHNQEVRKLNDYISEANRNIAETHELIDNVLVPQKQQLIDEIDNLNRLIVETEQYIETTTTARNAAHEEFNVRVEEHHSALEAIAEALSVLSQLNGDTSLIQMKKFEKSIQKVQKTFQGRKNVHSTFVKALLQLTTQGFTDGAALERVFQLLRTIEGDLQTSLEVETAAENTAQSDFEADIARAHANIAEYNAQLQTKTEELARTEEQIQNSKEYIEQREFDRTGYQNDLTEENAAYERATELYNDLVNQLQIEAAACAEALDVVQNASIDDYIGDRMSQTSDHVIGTASRTTAKVNGDIV